MGALKPLDIALAGGTSLTTTLFHLEALLGLQMLSQIH